MDLESLEQSISFIQRLKDSESTIRSLTDQLQAKDQLIHSLQSKLLEYTSNTQLKSYISGLESTVKFLQQQVEQLQMVTITQQLSCQVPLTKKSLSNTLTPTSSTAPSLTSLLQSPNFWDCLSSYLSEEDQLKLILCTPVDIKKLLPKLKTLKDLFKKPERPEEVQVNREIRGLLKQ